MSDLIDRGGIPEGYKVEVAAVKAAGIARERVFGDGLVTFPRRERRGA
jgi:hypothetical protein